MGRQSNSVMVGAQAAPAWGIPARGLFCLAATQVSTTVSIVDDVVICCQRLHQPIISHSSTSPNCPSTENATDSFTSHTWARQELSSPEPTQPKVLLVETMVGCGLGDDEVRKET